MIKCPNCGSTAQFKPSTPFYFENEMWKQQFKCGCGCEAVVRYREEFDKIDFPKYNPSQTAKTVLNHWREEAHPTNQIDSIHRGNPYD